MSTALQPLIDDIANGGTLTLADGDYDDTGVVSVHKDIEIAGSRNVKIHSEFRLGGGATVRFNGVTLEMNKQGAPSFTGVPYGQNAQIENVFADLYCDDCVLTTTGSFGKFAVEAIKGNVHLRSINQFSKIDWRNCNNQGAVRLLYGSYCNMFGDPSDINNKSFNINIGSAPNGGVIVVGSHFLMSAANISNFGTSPLGINASRDSFVYIGVGAYCSVQSFGQSVELGDTSRKWVANGSYAP